MNKVLIVESEGSYDIYADDGVMVERVNLDSREPITLNLAFAEITDEKLYQECKLFNEATMGEKNAA